MQTLLRRHAFALCFALCLVASLAPLWVARHLPGVDLPQHLFLIHVLKALDDPTSPYHGIYVARPGLTYVTFYYTVKWLSAVVGVEVALKLWLTLVLGAVPFSMVALLKALKRSRWLALLSFPLLYTDNFYWGLVSFESSLPLTILVVAYFIRALEDPLGEWRSSIALGLSLIALQLTHAAGIIYPALALPLMLFTTPSDLQRRKRAIGALIPGLLLFFAWLFAGVAKGRRFGAPGEPWKASAPLLDPRNFVWGPEWKARLPQGWELLANGFWDWADRPPLYALAAAAALVVVLGLVFRQTSSQPFIAKLRAPLLFAAAAGFFLFLPSDITGYMYQIYPRYSQVAALLVIPLLPYPLGPSFRLYAAAATAAALYAGINLSVLFHRFDVEADNFEMVVDAIPHGAKIMQLVFDRGSRFASHAVYLHYPALAALRVDGVPSFSLAIDPSFPVGYVEGKQPPAPASEWHPEQFNPRTMATYYDAFLVRGDVAPQALFGPTAPNVELASQADRWRLFRWRR